MKVPKKLIALFVLSTPVILNAYYNYYGYGHSCSKPYKPIQISTRSELDQYLDKVEAYKACINNFITEQNDEIRARQSAINQAIEDWNNFVRYEMN